MADVIRKFIKDGEYYREWSDGEVEKICKRTYDVRDLEVATKEELNDDCPVRCRP